MAGWGGIRAPALSPLCPETHPDYEQHVTSRPHPLPSIRLAAAAAAAVASVVSDSVQPQRRQPTRLPRPRDSPGKNTGVGCHFLLQCMKGKVKVKSLSRVRLFATPWTAAYQAPPSMGFSRQEYWSGVPLPSPSDWLGSSIAGNGNDPSLALTVRQ